MSFNRVISGFLAVVITGLLLQFALICTPSHACCQDTSSQKGHDGMHHHQMQHNQTHLQLEDQTADSHEMAECDCLHPQKLIYINNFTEDAQEKSLGTGTVTRQPASLILVNQHKSRLVVGAGVPGHQKRYLRFQRLLL